MSLDTKLNNHELEFVNRLLEGCYKISSSIEASAFSLCVLLVVPPHLLRKLLTQKMSTV